MGGKFIFHSIIFHTIPIIYHAHVLTIQNKINLDLKDKMMQKYIFVGKTENRLWMAYPPKCELRLQQGRDHHLSPCFAHASRPFSSLAPHKGRGVSAGNSPSPGYSRATCTEGQVQSTGRPQVPVRALCHASPPPAMATEGGLVLPISDFGGKGAESSPKLLKRAWALLTFNKV